jgi:hypothetical protein
MTTDERDVGDLAADEVISGFEPDYGPPARAVTLVSVLDHIFSPYTILVYAMRRHYLRISLHITVPRITNQHVTHFEKFK